MPPSSASTTPNSRGIEEAARAGYLIRTRTDSPTADARANDTSERETAFASGAQYLSTDYYEPSEYFDSPYVVRVREWRRGAMQSGHIAADVLRRPARGVARPIRLMNSTGSESANPICVVSAP